jgi:hypothetical protein
VHNNTISVHCTATILLLLLLLQGDSHEVSLSKGRSELSAMIDHFVIRPGQDCLEASHRLYRLAVQAGFTKGRMVPQVNSSAATAGAAAAPAHDSSRAVPGSSCSMA